ncbi:TolC family protein [Roseivirga sp. BDSF3-8]|uniref:TolC family protein n=1 Tax=Roseivirga sp. BDSF3-8 TaxID=3241598 RepID=UPI003531A22B
MKKHVVFALCVYLLSARVDGQAGSMTAILQEIEQNNKELTALATYIESRELALKSGNTLPDPRVAAYYLPFGSGAQGNYRELEISQSMEFPTVYGARSNLIKKQAEGLRLDYESRRQAVLLEAAGYCLELVYLNKRLEVETLRHRQAQNIYEQVQELFEQDQVGILDLNKARLAWMQEQFTIEEIESKRQITLRHLARLNGGEPLTLEQAAYDMRLLTAGEKDSLWQTKLAMDPALQQLQKQQAIAEQQLKLTRHQVLPDLTAGYNYQNDSQVSFSGVYAGLSIPLWSSRHTVKAARKDLEYKDNHAEATIIKARAEFDEQFSQLQHKAHKYREYRQTLGELNTEDLLLQAYRLGELSFIAYYQELDFYRQAYDTMLEMEKTLFQLQTDLLKHTL